jgi:hypothetical protein
MKVSFIGWRRAWEILGFSPQAAPNCRIDSTGVSVDAQRLRGGLDSKCCQTGQALHRHI